MHNLAILLGCSSYAKGLAPLPLVKLDIEKMEKTLIRFCGCSEDNVIVRELTDDNTDPQNTYLNLYREFLNNRRKEHFDICFFYFSGHGESEDNKDVRLLLPDYDRGFVHHGRGFLKLTSVIKDFKDYSNISHIVCIIDTCRTLVLKDNGLNSYVDLQNRYQEQGVILLFGCSFSESAAMHNGIGSIYTHYLTKVLSETPKATVNDVIKLVDKEMQQFPFEQKPQSMTNYIRLGDIQLTEEGEEIGWLVGSIDKLAKQSEEFVRSMQTKQTIRKKIDPITIMRAKLLTWKTQKIKLIYYGRTYYDDLFSFLHDTRFNGVLDIILYDTQNDTGNIARSQDTAQQEQVVEDIMKCSSHCEVNIYYTHVIPTFRGIFMYSEGMLPVCGIMGMYQFVPCNDQRLELRKPINTYVYYCDKDSSSEYDMSLMFRYFDSEYHRMLESSRQYTDV